MAMPLMGSLRLVDAIGVHEAHYRGHGEQNEAVPDRQLRAQGQRSDRARHHVTS